MAMYTVLLIMIVADIDDTEVIWIALLRHAGKNTACLNKAIQITSVSSISATVLQYFGAIHTST